MWMDGLWPLQGWTIRVAFYSGYYPCWIIILSDCGKNRRDDDALLFATFLRRYEKKQIKLSPITHWRTRHEDPCRT